MIKILSDDYDPNRRYTCYNTVACKLEIDGVQLEHITLMSKPAYKLLVLKNSILNKHPELADDLDNLISLAFEVEQTEQAVSECE